MMSFNRRMPRVALFASASLGVLLCGCVAAPPPRPAPPPPPPPPVQTTIYAYPTNGQSAEQQDRDRYDCYQWAIQQTGFDPSSPTVPPHDRVQVVGGPPAVPPGAGVAAGAVTGGVLGALAAGPRDAGAGLLVGAILGGIVGGAAENAQDQAAAQAQANAQVAAQQRQQNIAIERKAADFKRAAGACPEDGLDRFRFRDRRLFEGRIDHVSPQSNVADRSSLAWRAVTGSPRLPQAVRI